MKAALTLDRPSPNPRARNAADANERGQTKSVAQEALSAAIVTSDSRPAYNVSEKTHLAGIIPCEALQ